jgi:hypothetical protein
MPRGGILPPAPVLAPGSALGSRPRVALSSARAPPVYSGPRPSGNAGISRLPARRGSGIRPEWRLDQEDVHGPSPTGGSSWCGVRREMSCNHHIIGILLKGGLSATGLRSSEATDLSCHLSQTLPSRPSRSAQRSTEGHGQRCSVKSPIRPIRRSCSGHDTLEVTGLSYPIGSVPDRP